MELNSNTIQGVAIISTGPIIGHGLNADAVTIQQAFDAIQANDGLRVTIAAEGMTHGDDPLNGYIAGYIAPDTVRIDGDVLRGDIEFLQTFERSQYFVELANTIPGAWGLSIVFLQAEPDNANARIARLFAAAIVMIPAANPTGLFSAQTQQTQTMTPEEIQTLIDERLAPLVDRITACEENCHTLAMHIQPEEDENEPAEATGYSALLDAITSLGQRLDALTTRGNAPATIPAGTATATRQTPIAAWSAKVAATVASGIPAAAAEAITARQNPELYNQYMAARQAGAKN
jgi:hypothetical protein